MNALNAFQSIRTWLAQIHTDLKFTRRYFSTRNSMKCVLLCLDQSEPRYFLSSILGAKGRQEWKSFKRKDFQRRDGMKCVLYASTNQNQDIFLLCQSGAKARREWYFPPKDRDLVCGSAGMELFTKKYQSRAQTRRETRHKEPRGNKAINCPRGIKLISHT